MRGQEDVFKRFHESFQNMDGRFHILEHRVPVEQQMEYFRFSDRIRKAVYRLNDFDYQQYEVDLQDGSLSKERKKRILSILASSKQVRAYRLLEKYVQESDPELVNWAYMALMESRITLESELSGEKQIYISTGLGGRGEKLRFYVLILSSLNVPFLDYQHEVIEKEFEYALSKNDCEIERLTIGGHYVELVFLIPVRADLKKILEDIIRECNLYGNFLSEIFTVTNVKELSQAEVDHIVEKYGHDKTSR
ncbi:MAG: hypothetical protein LBS79_11705 [Tannerella sp.]|jgi:hypothetical protein|nr:hypothetical protein [Tannerella sp.]